MFFSLSCFAQTAVNFNCNDCAATNHDLFTELNAGKVIVITWVMPCNACIPVALTVSNTVLGYASSNPGIVKFYLTDDYADTPCNTITSWATTNAITTNAVFSNALVSMADYGGPGSSMQKTVVLGGPNHTVYFNVNGTVSVGALQTAINTALLLSVNENSNSLAAINLFPNPVNGNAAVLNYSLTQNADVTIDIFNVLGSKVKSILVAKQTIGKHETELDFTGFNNGIYFVRLNNGGTAQTVKFILEN